MKKLLKKIIPLSFVYFIKRCLVYFPFEKPSDFKSNILNKYSFKQKRNMKLCIFSHFDRDNIIDDYVVYYLKSIVAEGFDIVFVSTSENLAKIEINKIENYCRDVIVKKNSGYDFGAWKSGMDYLGEDIDNYSSLLLCNDSVYAPLFPLSEMLNFMSDKYDYWGIVKSLEIYPHVQSYFMMFDKDVIDSEVFKKFWHEYKVFSKKQNIILQYEVGLSQKLKKSGFRVGAYCDISKLDFLKVCDVSHNYWQKLIEDFRCPMVKIGLLRDNPKNIDISIWENILKQSTDYDIELIKKHLNRVKN